MRKRIKKIQFKRGQDAKQSQMHKLTTNFIKWGYITTTENKAKYLKSVIDRLTYKAIKKSMADINILKSALRDKRLVNYMTTTVSEAFKDRKSGFVTMSRLTPRQGDSAKIAKVRWVVAIDQFMKPEEKPAKGDELKTNKEEKVKKESKEEKL